MVIKPILERLFGRFYKEYDFVKKSYDVLKSFGFTYDNAIASVCVCRDEISQTVRSHVKRMWGEAFNFSSLAGLFTAGKTGMKAFISHAPQVDGKERYVFYAFSHIAIDENENLGVCKRKGLEKSHACGALCLFLNELSSKKISIRLDENDLEESILKRRLLREIPYGEIPDLLTLTKITLKVIKEDLENVIEKVVDPQKSDYAVFTGIQVHGPEENYIVPDEAYVVFNGEKKKLEI
ncbi:hypothetical protein F1847_07675 [Thermodesulfobacterium sp. TA1]|uniref:hypothetical protein n=1 Tax=Thermodesulfobacterium sp. TA1 TaxID=2234087 RepID=UPI001231DA6C|nr:hypothetical protein [Thermodesulfobacterium sp. TA1]QER42622.1 hypothetical protein F1847_07675 [Thermodesulfobacterium sp. TA1]